MSLSQNFVAKNWVFPLYNVYVDVYTKVERKFGFFYLLSITLWYMWYSVWGYRHFLAKIVIISGISILFLAIFDL